MTMTTDGVQQTGSARGRLIEALRTIERLKRQLATPAPVNEPIAIVGMSCRLPGGADDPPAFWRLLGEGFDASREFPAERADARSLYDPDPDRPGRAYTINGSFLDRVDLFEPEVFGIAPREAVGMDPQQRLTLEVTWEALERAGHAPDQLDGTRTGVYVGVSTTDYVRLRQQVGDPDDVDAYQLIGEPSFIAGRIAYTLGLQGPAKVMDTTCSSSLVAVHEACQALRLRECDLALAGGANVMLAPYGFLLMSKFRALSADGRCKTFDAAADGYGRGEGIGMVVLRRLADALRDRDHIHAVVRGSAVNHDGRSSGLTVPNPAAQQAVIQAALAQAGIDPADIGYVEAHGTGTALGDPIELRALEAVIGKHHADREPLVVGSVKTNIGHLESAAGIAGLIKLVLAVEHGEIPPHLHLREPNPNVDWSRLHVRVPTERSPWPGPGTGAISSFGASGTNAHAIVGEAPPAGPAGVAEPAAAEPAAAEPTAAGADPGAARPGPGVLVASTRTPEALRELAGRWADHLRAGPVGRVGSAADVCFTSQVGRARQSAGLAVVGDTLDDLVASLDAHVQGRDDPRLVTGRQVPHRLRRVGWLFTGQGSQYAGMARDLATEPAFRAAFEHCLELADGHLDRPLREVVWPAGPETPLDNTRYTQPALFAVEYALAQLWSAWGPRPAVLAGHSVGEIVAACVAGVFSLDDAVRLVCARAQLMAELPAGGAMRSLSCDEQTARQAAAGFPDTVSVAGVNAPDEVVLSGVAEDVAAVAEKLAGDGVRNRPLTVSHAFHSPLMAPMLDRFRAVLETVEYTEPRTPLVSNLTGRLWTAAEVGPDYWVRHVAGTVRFADGVQAMYDEGVRTFVEIGPHPVLTGLGERTVPDPDCAWLPSLHRRRDGRLTAGRALAALHLRGCSVDWAAVRGPAPVRRVELPTTPWRGTSYWFRPVDPARAAAGPPAGPQVPGLGSRLRTATPTYELPTGTEPDLPGLVAAALAAAGDALGGRWSTTAEATLDAAAVAAAGDPRTVQVAVDGEDAAGTAAVTMRCIGAIEELSGAPWRTVGRVVVRRRAADDPAAPAGATPAPPGGDGHLVAVPSGAGDDPGTLLRAVAEAAAPLLGDRAPTGLAGLSLPAAGVHHLLARPGGSAGAVDVHLLDADQAPLGLVRGLVAEPAPAPAGTDARWERPDDLLLRVDWVDAETAVPADPAGTAVLLVADGGGVADRLAARLRDRGADCTVIAARPEPAELGAEVRGWLAGVTGPSRVVLLSGLDGPDPAGTDGPALRAAWCRDELGLVAVAQALDAAAGPPATVSVVTRGAQPAAPDQQVYAVAAAGLWGLGRVLALELPDTWGVAVDLDPAAADPDGEAGLLADALLTTDGEDEQALRAGVRRVARLRPDRIEPAALRRRPALRPDASYLVTGGLGGIGLAVARWLAVGGAGRIVLLGRSALPPRGTWDDPELPESVRLRVAGVRAVERLGAEVAVVSADVTDADALGAVVRGLIDGPLPLRGVVHAAGVSGPQFVRDVQEADYEAVWAPKVLGGWLLNQLTADADLDLFVSFSSIASVLGSQHLASYAAANAFLDTLAHHRRAAGRPALTANWGPWALPSALFGEDVMAFLRSVGLRALNADQCLALLGALLAADTTQVLVCAADWAMYKPVMEARRERPLLRELDIADDAGDGADSGLLDRLRSAEPAERTAVVLDFLRSALGGALGVAGPQLPADTDVTELGMDSIMAMEIVKGVRQQLAVAVRPSVLFERPTLDDWAAAVLAQVEQEHGLAVAAAAPTTADAPGAPAPTAPVARRSAAAGDWTDPARIKVDVTLDLSIRPTGPARDRLAPARRVLLTGATGFVGAFLLDELLTQTDAEVHCLVRAADPAEGRRRLRANLERYLPWRDDVAHRVVALPGDLAAPRLGLGEAEFAELAGSVDAIYHNGARVNFAHTYEQLRAPNVAGTEEILRLAALGGGTALHHVSSYGMWGLPRPGQGVIGEDDDIDGAGRLITGYVQSKWAAERLVLLARERGLPVDVHRPGRVLGDSRTGAALTTHFTTRVIKGCLQLGISPEVDIEVEMTPVDYVSRALVHISRTATEPNGNYHLINPHRMPFRELIASIRRRGWQVEPVDNLTWWAALRDTLGREPNELQPVMETVEELVVRGEENVDYGVGNAVAALAGSGIGCPPLDEALLDTYFAYLVRCGYLDPPAPASGPGREEVRG